MGAQFEIDVRQLTNLATQLREAGAQNPKILASAINATGKDALAAVRKSLIEKTGINPQRLDGGILRVQRATAATPRFVLDAQDQYEPLGSFNAEQSPPGATTTAWGTRKLYRGTFVATMNSGHVGVFRHDPAKHGRQFYSARRNAKGRVYYSETRGLQELRGPNVAVEMLRPPTPGVFEGVVDAEFPNLMGKTVAKMLKGINPANKDAHPSAVAE